METWRLATWNVRGPKGKEIELIDNFKNSDFD